MTDLKELEGARSILIQAPADVVYEYVCDFPRHTEWNHQPTEIKKISDGPVGVGTVFRAEEQPPGEAPWIIRKVILPLMWKKLGFVGYTEAEITALEPGRRLAWKAAAPMKKGGSYLKADWEILLEPQNGATQVTQRYHYKPQIERAENITSERAAQSVANEVDANLTQLKEILERRTSAEKRELERIEVS